eukprot:g16094.t1
MMVLAKELAWRLEEDCTPCGRRLPSALCVIVAEYTGLLVETKSDALIMSKAVLFLRQISSCRKTVTV